MFSKLETKILAKIDGEIKITDLVKKVYKGKKLPLNPNITVNNAIAMINRKCKREGLRWSIEGEGLGRKGKTVWFEKK